MAKYQTPSSESGHLPNLLGLTQAHEIGEAESVGFLFAQATLLQELKPGTRFDTAYVYRLHRLALGHLYDFAGQLRSVNMSKGGFPFPSAQFLPAIMADFERDFLAPLGKAHDDEERLRLIAASHAELLFIHPFREGNGRSARLLADLTVRQSGYGRLDFSGLSESKARFEVYILAVQAAATGDYAPMYALISDCLVLL